MTPSLGGSRLNPSHGRGRLSLPFGVGEERSGLARRIDVSSTALQSQHQAPCPRARAPLAGNGRIPLTRPTTSRAAPPWAWRATSRCAGPGERRAEAGARSRGSLGQRALTPSLERAHEREGRGRRAVRRHLAPGEQAPSWRCPLHLFDRPLFQSTFRSRSPLRRTWKVARGQSLHGDGQRSWNLDDARSIGGLDRQEEIASVAAIALPFDGAAHLQYTVSGR